jgi:PAS domain S-box-containing protein
MFTLKSLTHSGVSFVHNASEQRSVIVCNCISSVFFSIYAASLVVRFIFFKIPVGSFAPVHLTLYALPILMNRLGYIRISRIFLCWIPSVLIMVNFLSLLKTTTERPDVLYDALRIYLLAFSCLPFLLLSTRNKLELTIGFIVPAVIIIFCDPILSFFDGDSFFKTLSPLYQVNAMRTMIAFFLISGSSFSLKWFVESTEQKNELLIRTLAEKNTIIEKQAREQLQESTSRLALATDSAGIGIWELDPQTDNVIWDKQSFAVFGLAYQPAKKINWRDFIHEEDYDELIHNLDEALQGRKEFKLEFRIRTTSGEVRYVYSNARVYFQHGKAVRMIGVCWDITDEKISEQRLQNSEANLNAIINSTNFFIWSVNRNYELRSINRPFKNYIRQKYNTIVTEGESILKLYSRNILVEEFSERWIRHYTRALAGESFEITQIHTNRHFNYSINPIIENAVVTGVSVFAEETTALRKKEAELIEANKQISDLRLMALRAAMNPHFIFNTLNSIQYFIMNNDQLNAVNYLSTFSKLIRGILNNSVNSRIRLLDELDQLKYYVQLELLRFENKFNFKVRLAEDLDVDNIEIPSMLIQPYLENAIHHGLYNKRGPGCLQLFVKEEGKHVIFEIEDDGVGRAAAATFKLDLPQHKSLGMMLTEQRLKLINAQSGVSHQIFDLEENGKPAGTRVRIWIKA